MMVSLFLPGSVFSEAEPAGAAPVRVGDSAFGFDGEVLKVTLLREPVGSAIYKVKNFSSGETVEVLADAYRTLVLIRGEVETPHDVLDGSKAQMIYRQRADSDMPTLTYIKVVSSY